MSDRPQVDNIYPDIYVRSPALPAGTIMDEHVYVAMRDGIRLCIDIYKPKMAGRYPVLLSLSPYSKDIQQQPPHWSHAIESGATGFYVAHGYVHVIAQGRGAGRSQGQWRWFDKKERTDGIKRRLFRTSIPSKWHSPSSRPCCARPPNERSRDCGTRSANSSPSSLKANAPTISGTHAMREINRKCSNCDNRYANRRAPAGAFLVPIFGRAMICILGEPFPAVIAVRIFFAPSNSVKKRPRCT